MNVFSIFLSIKVSVMIISGIVCSILWLIIPFIPINEFIKKKKQFLNLSSRQLFIILYLCSTLLFYFAFVNRSTEKITALCIKQGIPVLRYPKINSNQIHTLSLGETVTWLDIQSTSARDKNIKYCKIKLKNKKEGWVDYAGVVPGARPGTVTNRATLYRDPDINAQVQKIISPAEFIAIKELQHNWARIYDNKTGENSWIEIDNISLLEEDIVVAIKAQIAMDQTNEELKVDKLQSILNNPNYAISELIPSIRQKYDSLIRGSDLQLTEKIPQLNDDNTHNLNKEKDDLKIGETESGTTPSLSGHMLHDKSHIAHVITEHKANVRKSADDDSEICVTLDKDIILSKIETKGKWTHVRIPYNHIGWIHKSVVRANRHSSSLIVRKTANIRQQNSVNSPIILKAQKGMKLHRIEQYGQWYRIETVPEYLSGWIHNMFINDYTLPIEYVVTKRRSILRHENSTRSRIVIKLEPGSLLIKHEEVRDWVKVQTLTSHSGWIHKTLVQNVTSSPTFLVTNVRCNIRENKSTRSKRLDRAEKGMVLIKIDTDRDWYHVCSPALKKNGWIKYNLVDESSIVLKTKNKTIIRAGRSVNSKRISRVAADIYLPLAIEGNKTKQDDWYRVYAPNTVAGWIHEKDVTEISCIDFLLFQNFL